MGTTTTIVDASRAETHRRLEVLARRAEKRAEVATPASETQTRLRALRDLAESAADYLDATPAADRALSKHAELLAQTVAARIEYLLTAVEVGR